MAFVRIRNNSMSCLMVWNLISKPQRYVLGERFFISQVLSQISQRQTVPLVSSANLLTYSLQPVNYNEMNGKDFQSIKGTETHSSMFCVEANRSEKWDDDDGMGWIGREGKGSGLTVQNSDRH